MSVLDYISNLNPFVNFTEMEEIYLSYPKLKERIGNRLDERDKAILILKEIRAELSLPFLRSFEKFLDATLSPLYDGINFNDNNLDIPSMLEKNNIVLVPNHQSHADYLAINYVYFKKYKTPLYVAGGNNLNIFPIGPLFRRSGCFFIRRSFANDILYKIGLEAYLYYMLYKGNPIEFFFEGGRSRTGKLLPPRYGLYQMLIEAHFALPIERRKNLMFIPVSIAHEYVPEQKSLIKESEGGKKKKESPAQVFGLVTLFSYRFGNIHINLGNPLIVDDLSLNLKSQTQKLAFDCFIEVGKNMRVTPTSIIAMILLDEPSGALKWEEILAKAQHMILFCNKFNIPITDSMNLSNYEKTLGRTIDILIGNKKVDAIGNTTGKVVFYSIKDEARKEILYFKNTILHHFLVPWIVHMAWMNLFSGHINNVEDLKKFFASQRRQLIHEFYLPTVREFLQKALDIISDSIGRQVTGLEECMNLTHKELYQILKSVAPFARSCNYLIEAYYICGLTLKDLHREFPSGFKMDQYTKRYKEIFEEEKKLQRLIRYPESYSVPLSKSSLEYYIHSKLVDKEGGLYTISDSSKLAEASGRFESELQSLLLTKLIN